MTAAQTKPSFTEALAYWEQNFPQFAQACLQIRTKEGGVESLTLNKAQQYIHERIEQQRQDTGKVRAIILKGRQQGCSTYVEARYYWRSIFRSGVRAFILAHEKDSTSTIYEMAKRYHENNPIAPKTGTSNARELVFSGLDSGYRIGTAGNESVGRGSTIQYFHGSEVAFWPSRSEGEITKGIFQAVPDLHETEIILESTANGIGNFFHSETLKCLRGEGEYQLIFIPWYWQQEYRKKHNTIRLTDEERALKKEYGLDDQQIAWRRNKITELTTAIVDGVKAFRQEYPCNIHEAFQYTGQDGMIKPSLVQKARSATVARAKVLVVGVDPSRGGDRFAVIRRAGRKMYGIQTEVGDINLGRQVQICKACLDNEKPDRMFIDAGGGDALVDRLQELGYGRQVSAIHFGGKPLNPAKYKNRRAEMWGELAEWLSDENLDVDIEDSDELQSDLCTPQASRDSMDRIVLESKDSIRKRGLPSPDIGDAAALTFAEPVYDQAIRSNIKVRGSFE